MTKNRFYIFIIIGLLISNMLLVAFILLKKPPQHSGPRNLIIERLKFDENQIRQYDELISQHRRQIREKRHEMTDLKTQCYSLLKSEDNKNGDSLINEIGKLSMETEKINYKHFQDIKRICRPDQMKNFDNLIDDFENLFNRPDKPPH
ncbi:MULTISPECIES: hypothetical protein [Chryseobacterium]|uniref:Periplasmic heavy metal sensor n=2 Tax=Chryseobacterium aquaticum TaxID=452084 RepID=A0A101CIR6_9FLAO|nr:MULTISPECIES: hypothetical protein [Chryseobacterium]KUJ57006.1 hypothetical protein AR686_04885 [Chryseobacterium aquaticum subsp. greenlandense]NMR35944.1 hypothetical protein [Chryseobacterium aquaticum]NRQ48019.1 hypothetical protein [Chryseobacterium sp. C-204]